MNTKFTSSSLFLVGLFSLTACFETKTVSLADSPSRAADKLGQTVSPYSQVGNSNTVDPLTSCSIQNNAILGSWREASASGQAQNDSNGLWTFTASCLAQTPEGTTIRFSETSSGLGAGKLRFAYDNAQSRECSYEVMNESRTYLVLRCNDGLTFMFVR